MPSRIALSMRSCETPGSAGAAASFAELSLAGGEEGFWFPPAWQIDKGIEADQEEQHRQARDDPRGLQLEAPAELLAAGELRPGEVVPSDVADSVARVALAPATVDFGTFFVGANPTRNLTVCLIRRRWVTT